MDEGELASFFNFAILCFLNSADYVKPVDFLGGVTEETEKGNFNSEEKSVLQSYAMGEGNTNIYNCKESNFYGVNNTDTHNGILKNSILNDNKSVGKNEEDIVYKYIVLSGTENFQNLSEFTKTGDSVYSGENTDFFAEENSVLKNTAENFFNNVQSEGDVRKKGYGMDTVVSENKNYGSNYILLHNKKYGDDTGVYSLANKEENKQYNKNYDIFNNKNGNYDVRKNLFNRINGFENTAGSSFCNFDDVLNSNIYGIDNGVSIFEGDVNRGMYGFEGDAYYSDESISDYKNTDFLQGNKYNAENTNYVKNCGLSKQNKGFNIFEPKSNCFFEGNNNAGDYVNRGDIFNMYKNAGETEDNEYVDYDMQSGEDKRKFFSEMQKLTNETNNYNNSGGSININMGGVTQNFASDAVAEDIMDIFTESLKRGLSGCGSRYLEVN